MVSVLQRSQRTLKIEKLRSMRPSFSPSPELGLMGPGITLFGGLMLLEGFFQLDLSVTT